MDRSTFRLLLAPLLLLALVLVLPGTARADAPINEPSVEYMFGGPLVFRARLIDETPVKEALAFFRVQGETRTYSGVAELTPTGELEYVYQPEAQPLRAFARIDYWFQIDYIDRPSFTSDVYSFSYKDNRYDWNSLSRESFEVHWYEGDLVFAQGVLDVAQEGLLKAQSLLPLATPQHIDIYIYASEAELQSTLRMARRDGIAGHAAVDLGLMVVSLPNRPDRRLEAERQVPHELMHILLYQHMGSGYSKLPTWLDEGLASVTELYPNPDYQLSLESAVNRAGLMPISSLCRGFPIEMSGFQLAYAQSAYFTRYLYRNYGSAHLLSLIDAYANGLDCERGFETVIGKSISQLEAEWLNDGFGLAAVPETSPNEVKPWYLLLFVVLGLPFLALLPGLVASNRKQRPQVG
jgi:hypothetical protein